MATTYNNNIELDDQIHNKEVVETLYKALGEGDTETVSKLLASDLEWWFHGPPHSQHMMRVLTGESTHSEFMFVPKSIEVVDDCVIAEGWEGAQVYWVHVWTIKDGLITKFREYFNTWLIVKGVKPLEKNWKIGHHNLTLWQSHPRDLYSRSLPSLLLAI